MDSPGWSSDSRSLVSIITSCDAALLNTRIRFACGADRAITQFFFAPETFFRFRDQVAAAGISAEIVPGIMPVSTFAGGAPKRDSG